MASTRSATVGPLTSKSLRRLCVPPTPAQAGRPPPTRQQRTPARVRGLGDPRRPGSSPSDHSHSLPACSLRLAQRPPALEHLRQFAEALLRANRRESAWLAQGARIRIPPSPQTFSSGRMRWQRPSRRRQARRRAWGLRRHYAWRGLDLASFAVMRRSTQVTVDRSREREPYLAMFRQAAAGPSWPRAARRSRSSRPRHRPPCRRATQRTRLDAAGVRGAPRHQRPLPRQAGTRAPEFHGSPARVACGQARRAGHGPVLAASEPCSANGATAQGCGGRLENRGRHPGLERGCAG